MDKNISIVIGDYFDRFINEQLESGKFKTASEVVRAALRLFEYEESKRNELIKELKKGENSGFVNNFDRHQKLDSLHKMYISLQ